jgi:ubiquinone biosynthesis protein
MIKPRSLQIVISFFGLGWAWLRLHRRAPQELPERLRRTIERLGTTFIKLGQGLSLRSDLLPAGYREALDRLHSQVPPFDSAQAVATVESAFHRPLAEIFADFDRIPFAAASVAQVHRARMPDGTEVAVKIRRPGIVAQVRTDLRLLRRLVGAAQFFVPVLRRQRPLELIDELSAQLLIEIDLEHEARNVRRLAEALKNQPHLWMPRIIEPYVHPNVLVQEYSHGRPVSATFGTERGREIAGELLDAYLYQLFVAGVFHGDPHPGNLFDMPDGTLCFHDFGLIGYLDPQSRMALAQMFEAVARSDAEGALDGGVDLGFISGSIDRREYQGAISEILSDLSSLPLAQWSVAEAMWRIAKLGSGEHFKLPRRLLVLLRALFLAESTIRELRPDFDLLGELTARTGKLAQAAEEASERTGAQPMAVKVVRAAQELPGLLFDLLRQARAEDGRPGVVVHHRGLEELEVSVARTGNRLSMALVTLGLYVAGSLLMLHSAGPRVLGDVPVMALIAFALALLLSARLLLAISRSGKS